MERIYKTMTTTGAGSVALGIVVSMFTALVITRVIMKLFYNFGITDVKWYGRTIHTKKFNFLGIRKWCFIGSAVVILAGFIGMAGFKASGNRALNYSLEFVGYLHIPAGIFTGTD